MALVILGDYCIRKCVRKTVDCIASPGHDVEGSQCGTGCTSSGVSRSTVHTQFRKYIKSSASSSVDAGTYEKGYVLLSKVCALIRKVKSLIFKLN
jgi:hypothetical protein